MANWKQDLRPALWRGLPCHVLRRDVAGGRRGADHEFYGADLPDPEDAGALAEGLTVDLVILGADYLAAARKFERALNAFGPGTYRDPWRGDQRVQVRSWKRSEDVERQGAAFFSVTFTAVGRAQTPATGRGDRRLSALSADTLEARLREVAGWLVDGTIANAAARDLMAQATALSGWVTGALPGLSAVTSLTGLPMPSVATLATSYLSTVAGNPAGFVAATGDLFAALPGSLWTTTPLGAVATGAASAVRGAMATIWDFDPGLPGIPQVDGIARVMAASRAAATGLIRGMGTVTEVRAAAAEDFDSRQSALAARDGLLSRLDALASDFGGQVGGDPVVAAARSARLALATDLTTRAGALPSLRAVAPVAPVGSLLMAQRLYGDATRAPELVARNQGKVRHPLFLPPGEDLEALER